MAEFEALKNRNTGAKKAPATKRTDNKYKAEIDRIFAVLGCDVVKEYRFHKTRLWRWDYCIPEPIKIAVEYQGLAFHGGTSRHQTLTGIAGDNIKFSEGAIAGWLIILVDATSVASGEAHSLIKRAIDSRRMNIASLPGVKRNRLVSEPI